MTRAWKQVGAGAIALLLTLLPGDGRAQSQIGPLRVADFDTIVHLDCLAWSPDGEQLAAVARPLLGKRAELWIFERTGAVRSLGVDGSLLAANPAPRWVDDSLSWTPDGRALAFRGPIPADEGSGSLLVDDSGSATDSDSQPYIWWRDESRIEALPAVEGGLIDGPRWSPDGQRLCAVARPIGPAEQPGILVLYERLEGGGWSLRQHDGTRVARASWAPDGRRLALVWANVDGQDAPRDLYPTHGQGPPLVRAGRLHLGIAELDDLQALDWLQSEGTLLPDPPAWSPDGSHLAVRQRVGESDQLQLWTVEEGEFRVVLETAVGAFGPPLWMRPQNALIVSRRDDTKVHLMRLDLSGDEDEPGTSREQWMSQGLEYAGSLKTAFAIALSNDGRQLAYVRSTPRTPDEIMWMDGDVGELKRLSRIHLSLVKRGLSSVESVRVSIANEERDVLLTYPNTNRADRPWPLLYLLQNEQSLDASFEPVSQLLAGVGWLVVRMEGPVAPIEEIARPFQERNLADFQRRRVFELVSLEQVLEEFASFAIPTLD